MPTTLHAGAARVEITPPIGLDLSGFIARQNPSTALRDPLYARALVVEDGNRQAALVSVDVIGFPASFTDDVRRRVALATGIPGPALLLAATHTHGGPATMFLQGCGTPDPAYLERLQEQITSAVIQAQANRQPAVVSAGSAESVAGVFNRRTPGDIIDPSVGLLRFKTTTGAPIALVVNYTCHPTTLHFVNRSITADYPGLVSARLEEATGGVTLFLMGAIGDVGPMTRGEESLATVGNAVADAALAALPDLSPLADPRLDTAGELLQVPLLPLPTREDLIRQRAAYRDAALAAEAARQADQAKIQWALMQWAERMVEQQEQGALTPTVPAEIQMLRIGEVIIAGIPGEFFVELGLQIKQGIAGAALARQVMICGFANDNIGYIPARRAYAQGGYEVSDAYHYYGYPAALAPEAGEQIVAETIEMVRQA